MCKKWSTFFLCEHTEKTKRKRHFLSFSPTFFKIQTHIKFVTMFDFHKNFNKSTILRENLRTKKKKTITGR